MVLTKNRRVESDKKKTIAHCRVIASALSLFLFPLMFFFFHHKASRFDFSGRGEKKKNSKSRSRNFVHFFHPLFLYTPILLFCISKQPRPLATEKRFESARIGLGCGPQTIWYMCSRNGVGSQQKLRKVEAVNMCSKFCSERESA